MGFCPGYDFRWWGFVLYPENLEHFLNKCKIFRDLLVLMFEDIYNSSNLLLLFLMGMSIDLPTDDVIQISFFAAVYILRMYDLRKQLEKDQPP